MMKITDTLLLLGMLLVAYAGMAQMAPLTTAQNQQIEDLIKSMTLDELVGQTVLFTSDWDQTGPTLRKGYEADIEKGKVGAIFNAYTAAYTRDLQRIAVEKTRLGIPLLFGYDVIHGHRTIFPIPLAEAASWDTVLVQGAARIAAREAAAAGLHWTFAPMVDVARDPRWGRVMEGSGEDVALGSAMARARVRGFQGDDLAADSTLLACVKHFAAYGAAQAGRDYHTVDMSDRVLREVYLPPYKAALDAGALSVMTSFNEVDGMPASASSYLLTEILRDEWGFDGFVVTDYTSINEMMEHGVASDERHAAKLSFSAGVDMDMQGATFYDHLAELSTSGEVNQAALQEAVRRILRVKMRLGLFDDPYRYSDPVREEQIISSSWHLSEARRTAAASMVLLKHGEQSPLPISADEKIALIGPLVESTHDMIGSWHANGRGEDAISPRMGFEAWSQNLAVTTGTQIQGGLQGTPATSGTPTAGFAEALRIAADADVIIACVGETAPMSGEAASRAALDLPGDQLELLKALRTLGKPMVTVVFAGRPLVLTQVAEVSDALLYAWWPGSQAGHALVDVLSGKVNPSARLPMTFPAKLGQVPLHYDMKRTGRPFDEKNKYTSKYLDASNEPLYPFGFGLGYSDMEYAELASSANSLSSDGEIEITLAITNKGKFAQRETVQFYLRDAIAQRTRPELELIGWQQLDLGPGETKTALLRVQTEMLTYLGPDGRTPTLDPGKLLFYAGPNAAELSKIEVEFTGQLPALNRTKQ